MYVLKTYSNIKKNIQQYPQHWNCFITPEESEIISKSILDLDVDNVI